MTNRPGLDFSFSGLKTHTLTATQKQAQKHQLDEQTIADIALAFELAVVDTLKIKCSRALSQTMRKRLVVAGGVGANQRLRATLQKLADQNNVRLFCPRAEFCTDNGAMIAYAGYFRLATEGLANRRLPLSTTMRLRCTPDGVWKTFSRHARNGASCRFCFPARIIVERDFPCGAKIAIQQ